MSFDAFAERAALPKDLRLVFNTFARAFFADGRRMLVNGTASAGADKEILQFYDAVRKVTVGDQPLFDVKGSDAVRYNAGPGGEGARMPQTFIQEPTTPKRQSFIVAYLKTFNPKNSRIDSPVSAAQGYDSIYLLAAAVPEPETYALLLAGLGFGLMRWRSRKGPQSALGH